MTLLRSATAALLFGVSPASAQTASTQNTNAPAVAAAVAAMPVTAAPAAPDLGAMLRDAQRYTVKVRATVNWPLAPEQFGTGQGTGFVIDRAKGWILTNAHVAKRSPAAVEVALTDSETDWLPVERLYADNFLDIAVVKIDPEQLPPDATQARLGCGEDIKQGSAVVAYGHPINLTFTATRGIVSSVRTLGYQEFVQMDASINPGNSGGPLLGVDAGAVIGVNTANFPGAPGLGLATSIRHVCPIMDLLARGEDPTVPTLPVYWLKQGRNETLTVAAAFPNAGDVGLRTGDVVLGIAGGRKAGGLPDLITALRGRKESVALAVRRDGAEIEVKAPLVAAAPSLKRQALTFAGLLVVERQALDQEPTVLPPLRIEFIKQGEAAARAGLQAWDYLETVSGQRFRSVAALHDWLKARPSTEKVAVMVRRHIASFDRRIGAEYHRFEIAPSDLKLLTAGD
jgi:serine protease Do